MVAQPSLTPAEDGYRRAQEANPLPTDPFAAGVIRALRSAKIEEARLLDRGQSLDMILNLAGAIAASVIESAANTYLSTEGRNHPDNLAELKDQLVSKVRATLRRKPGHHVTSVIDRGDKPGRG